ncbi:MAG: indolepyruvate oxidoreductase subunit beta [Chloroflexi bacterium]|nr:MAG: indolepyruvate oxidoreductase subunit beta [Chloroflexota bacterium]
MRPEGINFALVGVGGQGTILASDVLAELGLRLGYDVKKAEVHGMSQRGGSVTSHLRWGAQVFSPIIPRGEADVLIAFEKLEAARFIEILKPGGLALVNDYAIEPLTVLTAGVPYPGDEVLRERLTQVTPHAYWVKGIEIAEGLGNARVANMVLLGALSGLLDLDEDQWNVVLEQRVPAKHLNINHQAFHAGREAVAAAV